LASKKGCRDEDKVKNNAIDDILNSMDLTPQVVCKKTKSNTIDDLLDSKDIDLKDVDDVEDVDLK
jgi:hypothetical protein